MDEPVGYAVGNSLEIIEVIECLKGNIPEDVREIILTLGSYIIKLSGNGNNLEENKQKIKESIIAFFFFTFLFDMSRFFCIFLPLCSCLYH